MVRVSIHFSTKPEKKTEFEQVVQALKAEIKGETGCLGCEVYQNLNLPNEFLIVEQWKDEAHVRDHLKSQNLAVLCGTRMLLTGNTRVALHRHTSIRGIEKEFVERFDNIP